MRVLYRVGRADIHIHTKASDGISTIEETVDSAVSRGDLDVIAITDHNTVESAYAAAEYAVGKNIEVIIGSEISSSKGHIVGLWITEDIPAGLTPEDTVDAIHEQGGIAVVAHPFANKAFGKFGLESIGEDVAALRADAIEVYNSTPYMLPYANRLAYRAYAARNDIAAVGGSDAHIPAAIGKGITVFPGKTGADLREAIENRTTDGTSGFASKILTLNYIIKYRLILKQQKINLERCKPGEESKKKGSVT